ncbi:TonB dependent receptor [compost metagenome]
MGLNLVANFGDNSTFKVYPNLYAELQAIEKYLSLYGGLTGDLQKNSLRDLSSRNPFLGANINLANSNERMKAYGGLKGTIITGLGFKFQFAYSSIDSLAFYTNNQPATSTENPFYGNKYHVIYAGEKNKKTTITANLDYAASDRLRLGFEALYNTFDLDNMAKPWLTPKYRVDLSATFQPTKTLSFTANLFNVGEQYALVDPAINSYRTLSGYTDLNLGFNYGFHKNFGVFANANNILGKNYDLFLNYPSYGFNFIAGISVTF